ncbi:hypothetical protein MTBLM5_510007 [Magnetospirillum sp. LM-5]|nr:hypothetical protein MTBLM5_510007 [Magnetospirillum sp. LM-5]
MVDERHNSLVEVTALPPQTPMTLSVEATELLAALRIFVDLSRNARRPSFGKQDRIHECPVQFVSAQSFDIVRMISKRGQTPGFG